MIAFTVSKVGSGSSDIAMLDMLSHWVHVGDPSPLQAPCGPSPSRFQKIYPGFFSLFATVHKACKAPLCHSRPY